MDGQLHVNERRFNSRLRVVVLLLAALVACQRATNKAPEQVQQALHAGNYVEAERLAQAWLAEVERDQGNDSLASARALDVVVEASVRNGNVSGTRITELAGRAVRLKERHLGGNDHDTATSLFNLGWVHVQRGEFSASLEPLERSLRIRSALARDTTVVGDTLDVLALALIRLERFQQANQRIEDSLRIREKEADTSPLALAHTLDVSALSKRYTDNYADALALLDRAREIRVRFSPSDPDAIFGMQVRGDVLLLVGDAKGAQQAWAEALQRARGGLRSNHPLVAETLGRMSLAEFSSGNLNEARRLAEQGREIGAQSLAPCDPTLPMLDVAVADSLRYDGEYAEASKLYKVALGRVKACSDLNAPPKWKDAEATLVFNDAGVARDVGDLAEASRLYERAVEIWSESLGPDHSFVARGLDALAEVAASQGELKRARTIYDRALATRRRSLGPNHPLVAWTLTSLASTVATMGDLTSALEYLEEAVAIYERSGASDEPDHFARVLELRGVLEAKRGNLSQARKSLTQALVERTRIFGESHPLVAQTRSTLAAVDLAAGDSSSALAAALSAERAGREHLLFTVRYLPERQALTYAASRPRGLDLALTIASTKTVAEPSLVLDALIRSRGIILDELAARPRATANTNAATKAIVDAVTSSRQRFANLVVRSLEQPVARSLLDEARQQKEDAERALAEHSVETRAELSRLFAGFDDVRRAVPSDAALVSFVRYERTTMQATGHAPGSSSLARPAYAAFVTRAKAGETTFISLGSSESIDAAIAAWRREASGRSLASASADAERRYRAVASRLRRALWDPLKSHTEGVARVFVVPDGLINLVNLAALPDGRGYIVESGPVIHYLTTERDLLSQKRRADAPTALLAVGGPAFDDGMPTPKAAPVMRGTECQSLARVHFEGLPGSLSEIKDISSLWPRNKTTDVTLLSGTAATESAVKKMVGGHRVVHLATHGFFLDGECGPSLPGLRAVGGIVRSSASATVTVDNPLLLTGLALAGANNRGAAAIDQDEGLLTADEIAGLDLRDTEWAVLSACDTGLGEIKAGEGVFGLRRAFQIAGARTVIMSLWSVEDAAARQWMRALYEARLRKKLDTASALRDADLEILHARRAKGQSTHPFYWAAFVAAGDWR